MNWYAIEEGDAWRRNGNIAMALKRYNDVEEALSPLSYRVFCCDLCVTSLPQHFQQYYNDEYDYHAYCLRKNTLRAYVQTIRQHDRVRDHPFWFRAATRTVEVPLLRYPSQDNLYSDARVQTYLQLIDNPPKAAEIVDKELEGLSEQEKKKVLAKVRLVAVITSVVLVK